MPTPALIALAALGWLAAGLLWLELRHARSLLAPFDRDGDGKPGGSRKRA